MDYFNDISNLVKAIEDNPRIPNKSMLIGPSLASGPWEPKLVWDTNYIPAFSKNLHAITMEQYVTACPPPKLISFNIWLISQLPEQ